MKNLFFFTCITLICAATAVLQAQGTDLVDIEVHINDFSPGLNTYLDAARIGTNQATSISNFSIYKGLLSTRGGSTLKSTLPMAASVPIQSMFYLQPSNGLKYYVVQCGSSVFVTQDDVTWSWSQLWTGASTYKPMSFMSYNDILWGMNPVDDPHTWDLVTVDTLTYNYLPSAEWAVSHKRRTWFAGVPGAPNTLFWSDVKYDPELEDAWKEYNAFNINPGDGDYITGLFIAGDDLVITKSRRMYRFFIGSALSDMTYKLITDEVGCVDGHSIQKLGNVWLFQSNEGVYATNGYSVQNVCQNVSDDLKNVNNSVSPMREWRSATSDAFDQGTYTLTESTGNYLSIADIDHTWPDDAAFGTGVLSSVTVKNDMIVITTVPAAAGTTEAEVTYDNPSFRDGVANEIYATDWERINDDSVGTYAQIKFNAAWDSVTQPISHVTSYRITKGSDYYLISIPLATEQTITKMSWSYAFPELGEAYSDNIHVQVKYLDSETGRYEFFSTNQQLSTDWSGTISTIHPNWTRLNVDDTTSLEQNLVWLKNATNNPTIVPQDWYVWYENTWSGEYTGNAFTKEIQIRLFMTPGGNNPKNVTMQIYNLDLYGYGTTNIFYSTAQYTTAAADLKVASPLIGRFEAVVSSPMDTSVYFEAKTSSADVDATWNSNTWYWVEIDSVCTGLPRQRYMKLRATLYSPTSSYTPSIYKLKINALHPQGSYESPVECVYQVTEWGKVILDSVLNGGNIQLFVRGSTSTATVATSTYTALTSGDTIPLSTSSIYVQYKTSHTTTAGDKDPMARSVTLSWYTGPKGGPCASTVFDGRYIHSVSTTGVSSNTLCYVTPGDGSFTQYTIPAAAFLNTGKHLYYGSSQGPYLYEMETSSTMDNGAAIATLWQSKDIDLADRDMAERYKYLDMVTIVGKSNDVTKPLYVGFSGGYSTAWSTTTVYLATGNYSYKTVKPPVEFGPEKVWRIKLYTVDGGLAVDVRNLTLLMKVKKTILQ